jgi:glycosyltransferase involved in cell wall biosynthesis
MAGYRSAARPSSGHAPPTLLCVANFPTNTGYAWDFIESLYARVADRLAPRGVRTLVAYPEFRGEPRSLAGSATEAVELPFAPGDRAALGRVLRFVSGENVRAVYLTDHPACSPVYALLRVAGVKHLVVHDHTSGARTVPAGLRRAAKWLYARVPGFCADVVVGVSEYVCERTRQVSLVPPDRVVRVWNGLAVRGAGDPAPLRESAGVSHGRRVVVCCCRAHPVKGVAHLLRAFDAAWRSLPAASRPVLVYIGDGPQRAELDEIRESLAAREDVRFLGYRDDAARLLEGADLCVVPSVWEDALPLGVLEPMALGKPVVATAVGGVPEMVENGATGLLVPPGDEDALAAALLRLLRESDLALRMGERARGRVAEHFTPESQIDALAAIVGRRFGGHDASAPAVAPGSPLAAERA